MAVNKKTKKRGFIMTGGGAKGLYEAGVINAFHITGMEFDVITGSSIGAMNSAFFAEYLYHKQELDHQKYPTAEDVIEAMEPRVRSFHHAWLSMPDRRVFDDSPGSSLARLKDDLAKFDVSLSQLTRLAWWWSDPSHGALPDASLWPTLLKLFSELAERQGGVLQMLRFIKNHRKASLQEAMQAYIRDYLANFGMEYSLIPGDEDHKLKDVFSQPISPLRAEHLDGDVSAPDLPGVEKYALVDPSRTLREYAEKDIEVRLTRANYRTGRLEISAYVPKEKFVRFMESQVWRVQRFGPDKLPLGSFRMLVPGNPIAINAALCSGRFPGVFTPYPIDQIYPQSDPDNAVLYGLLERWLEDPQVEAELVQAHTAGAVAQETGAVSWPAFESWRESKSMREFFPRAGDAYVDGGAIDNTPSNSAVDYVREWIAEQGASKRGVSLDLFVIFLGVEPKIDQDQAQNPGLYEVVNRTLGIVGVAKESSDANTVRTINTFGQRAEELGTALQLVLESYREQFDKLGADEKRAVGEGLLQKARQSGQRGYLSGPADGVLDRMAGWAEELISEKLPLHVEEIKIYPQEMPLDTLQFTERFGYRKENAIKMMTMGCYNTLWALRSHLEEQKAEDLDEQDRLALRLVRKWMGEQDWPKDFPEQETLRQEWRCQRSACVYHAKHCPRGSGAVLDQK